jgi:hypothetical protein
MHPLADPPAGRVHHVSGFTIRLITRQARARDDFWRRALGPGYVELLALALRSGAPPAGGAPIRRIALIDGWERMILGAGPHQLEWQLRTGPDEIVEVRAIAGRWHEETGATIIGPDDALRQIHDAHARCRQLLAPSHATRRRHRERARDDVLAALAAAVAVCRLAPPRLIGLRAAERRALERVIWGRVDEPAARTVDAGVLQRHFGDLPGLTADDVLIALNQADAHAALCITPSQLVPSRRQLGRGRRARRRRLAPEVDRLLRNYPEAAIYAVLAGRGYTAVELSEVLAWLAGALMAHFSVARLASPSLDNDRACLRLLEQLQELVAPEAEPLDAQ